jgi:hypothetical protein
MDITKIVLPGTFSVENWILYFEMASQVFTEQKEQLYRYSDEDFTDINTLGALDFEDASTCKIYLVHVKRALSERASRRKQFSKATEIIKQENTQAGLFVFYDSTNSFRLSLVYPIYKGIKRSFSNFKRHSFYVSDNLPNKTYRLQLGKYELSSMSELKDAFSVDKVSDVFYQEFEKEYHNLQAGISHLYQREVTEDQKSNFALLFVLRIIFLGFVQKKGWLGDNPNFIKDFIKSYDPSQHPQGIYQDLLCPLFFTALNSAPSAKNTYGFPNISEPFKSQLVSAPYLNGGLFRKHQDYDTDALIISNEAIEHFTGFLFSYNFTLEENTLYDEELELNPEFLGIIFEKLINKEYGAIYTPRQEVDFMCRIALVKYLQQNSLPSISLENLYKLFFPEYGDESEQTAGDFTELEAKDLLNKLETVSVCDPAIGSGAFAVGMLNVIDEIECSIYHNFLPGASIDSPYERKKRIIFQSLYGVEVKQWAVWITQLRLWITLLIEAEDSFKHSEEPLLPSFDFKIRQGDSLIQMLGNNPFPISGEGIISTGTKKKIAALMKLKTEYFFNKCPLKLHEIEQTQTKLYTDILSDRKKELTAKLHRYENAGKQEVQTSFLEGSYQSEIELTSREQEQKISELKFQISQIDHEIHQLGKHNLPFIWRIDFPEIFMQKGGFDIVIGNPPYVAQEDISDPLDKTDVPSYKSLLKKMASQDFPKDIPESSISGKSDLYTFFYIRGLKILNDAGILCYICSNSWLDVEFGAWLQKFLLERCPIHFIIDNLHSRVFKDAGINTIISVIGSRKRLVRGDDKIRFVAFKLPFEESLYTENFIAIEETKSRKEYDDLRVNSVDRDTLSKEGWENSKKNKYGGSKWGGIYIKAPSIYFTIMEKAKEKLVKVSDVARVVRGFTTGADEFFYIPKSNPHNIEKEFLKPVIKSPRECKSIQINPEELGLWLFMCPHEKHELKGTNALKYIEMGEKAEKYIKQGKDKGKTIVGIHNVSTVKARRNWYDLGIREQPQLITPSSFGDTFKVYTNNSVYANKRLYEIYYEGRSSDLALLMNSSLFFFFLELYSSTSLGDGLLDKTVSEIESMYVVDPVYLKQFTDIDTRINAIKHREIKSIFAELQVDEKSGSYSNANPLPDRKALDELVFSILGFTDVEVQALYIGLLELTANRLRKARTFK